MTAFELRSATACGIHPPSSVGDRTYWFDSSVWEQPSMDLQMVRAQGGSDFNWARECGGCTVVFETARQGSNP